MRKTFSAYQKPFVTVYSYLVVIPVHYVMCYVFVVHLGWGVEGTATALVISWWLLFFVILSYALLRRDLPPEVVQHPFRAGVWSLRGFTGYLEVALPCMAMLCLDWWSFEFGALLVGLLHDPVQLAAHVATANIQGVGYMSLFGFNQAMTVIVGGAIGQGKVTRAKQLAFNVASVGVLCGFLIIFLISFLRKPLALFYTTHQSIDVRVTIQSLLSVYCCYVAVEAVACMQFGVCKVSSMGCFHNSLSLR
jgi:MATE family multidrug resistance protein